ncbi:MAG: MFS transporter [Porticoccaceae bacterium]
MKIPRTRVLSAGDKFPAFALPRDIWVLGVGSLFMDMSSELVHGLLPLFMASGLGASMVTIGLVEGVAEATAAVTKVFSGSLSDWLGKRKLLMVLGYGLAALTKPVFPLAGSVAWVLGARFVDRLGKGIRGAPRDALIADIAPPPLRGAAYGLRQALDSVGAFAGPLLAVAGMAWFANDFRAAMWLAVPPAFIAVALLFRYVREPEAKEPGAAVQEPLALRDAWRLPQRFWQVVLLGAVFTLARFSEAFLVLRAQSVGFELMLIPLVMVVMNVFYALCAYPAGAAADRHRPRTLLLLGLMVLIASDLLLAVAAGPVLVLVGAALWGIHMALTQGLLAKLIADTAPVRLRGTAFGIFNLVSGGALLAASAIAGVLWSALGAPATFVAGAAFAGIAAAGLLAYRAAPSGGTDSAA